jgi:gamma-glutamyltranspeptidase/glutathione hydrolase
MIAPVRIRLLLPALLLVATGSIDSQGPAAQPRAQAGVVVSAHPHATAAGVAVLEAGGNAFDAAVAVAAALNVVEPAMSGLGGYGTVMTYHAATGRTRFLNTSGRIPAGVDSDAYRAPTPGYEQNRLGSKAVSTPVNLRGWEALWKEYGSREWPSLFDPAIALARDGFDLTEFDARVIADAFETFPAHARTIFGRQGAPLRPGERLVQADLARTFTTIASSGAAGFYEGEIASRIDAAMRQSGGFLALTDLKRAAAEWYDPIRIRYRGIEVVTASPPANTFDFLVRLGIMSTRDLRALGHNSPEYLHTFAEASKHGFWVRLRYAGDPEVAPPPLGRLLSETYWKEQASLIDPMKARPFEAPRLESGGDHTTHFVVADAAGNIVSATQTLGNAFGARIMAEGTGVWLNNSLAYSTFEPKGNPMDAHAGRHKLSGDCPTILLRDGKPWIALGTPGGHTIGQTVPQIIMNLVDFGMSLPEALAAPRISFAQPDVLLVERTLAPEVRKALAARGHQLREVSALGNATALAIEYGADGRPSRFAGAADPRGIGRSQTAAGKQADEGTTTPRHP